MLRPYQSTVKDEIRYNQSLGIKNNLAVLPTGAGKTVVMANLAKEATEPEMLIAHRQELVSQISMALARVGAYHRIIAPQPTINFIIDRHVTKFGRSFYHSDAPCAVAGVDTLVRRIESDELKRFLKQVKEWQTDEGHHLQIGNKWHAATQSMPNAFGVGWTATPVRPNGQSLGRLRTGVFDRLVVGPSMRELINERYLCEYKIFGKISDIDLKNVLVSSSTGDFNSKQLRDAAHQSHITGDIVAHYNRLAPGKRGVTFAVDVEMAEEHAAAFRQAGVPAEVIHAKTPDRDRVKITERFERGETLQIVNVDVLGEGYDCPAIEVVQFARPTQSYGLFVQQFGRGLRTLPGKSHGLIIDHVGNVMRHGLPDAPREWSLDGVKGNPRSDDLPIRTCPECWHVFEGYARTCPECGFVPPRAPAGRPEMVEGDLTEFEPGLLARLRGEADRLVSEHQALPHHAGRVAVLAATKRQAERRTVQLQLRDMIASYAGIRQQLYGEDDSTIYRRFYRTFGVDMATAQTLNAAKAEELHTKIRGQADNDYTARRA